MEVFDRRIDPETNQPYDDQSNASRFAQGLDLDGEPLLNQMQPGEFVGLQKNEDELTRLLVTKDDQIKEIMNRQIVFGRDGKPILDKAAGKQDGLSKDITSMQGRESPDIDPYLQEQDLIQRMKEELAVDQTKQLQLQKDLNLPKFEMGEQIQVDEDEVSDDLSELGDEDDEDEQRNQALKDNYNKIKERLKKQKLKGDQ